MLQTTSRNFGLDLIRAIAISLVVVSHCTYLITDDSQNIILTALRTLGAIGVDLFFVLSGYLIGGILLKEIDEGHTGFRNLITFWKRRWLRTLPNYFLVLILNIILFVLLGNAVVSETWLYFPFLQNFSTTHPDFFTEAWSLSIEEYAYLLLPFLLYTGLYFFKPKHKKRFFAITTMFVIMMLFLLKLKFYFETEIISYKHWSATFRKVVVYRIDSIYLGFLLVYILRRYAQTIKKYRRLFFVVGLFLFVSMHITISYFDVWPQNSAAFYVFVYLQLIGISLGFMFPLAISLKATDRIRQLIYYVSTRSYAIYLVNFSLILLTIRHFYDISSISMDERVLLIGVYLFATLAVSEVIYAFFERPILNFRDKKYNHK